MLLLWLVGVLTMGSESTNQIARPRDELARDIPLALGYQVSWTL